MTHRPTDPPRLDYLPGGDAPLLLRIPDAARLLSVSRETLYKMIKRGEFPVVLIGKGSMRIDRADILAWIRTNKEY